MKNKLPTVLSVTALIIALMGATGVAQAVVASFAANAGKLSGFKASKQAKKNTVVVRGANGKIGAASIPAQARGARGATGAPGAPGPAGAQGIQGIQGVQGVPGAPNPNAANSELLDGLDSTEFGRIAQSSNDAFLGVLSPAAEQTLLQVTITVPPGRNPQFVEVHGQFVAWDNANGECSCEIDYRLAEEGTGNISPFGILFITDSPEQNGSAADATWVFTAAPGVHTYNLRANTFSNTTNPITIAYRKLQARTVLFGATGGSTLSTGASTAGASAKVTGPASAGS